MDGRGRSWGGVWLMLCYHLLDCAGLCYVAEHAIRDLSHVTRDTCPGIRYPRNMSREDLIEIPVP